MNRETNLEHYKNELKNILRNYCFIPELVYEHIGQELDENIFKSKKRYYTDMILDWMSEPYKGLILDEAEKDYLSAVIKPFRPKVAQICKQDCGMNSYYIEIVLKPDDDDYIDFIELPKFKRDMMYEGMEAGKAYSLEELGL